MNPQPEATRSAVFRAASYDVHEQSARLNELLVLHGLNLDAPLSPQDRAQYTLGYIAGIESVLVNLAEGIPPSVIRDARYTLE